MKAKEKIKLQQVFQNLLSNAIKYNDKSEGLIDINVKDKGDHYEFSVKDNGPGISTKDQEIIFRLFQTSDTKVKNETSTGVGLFIIKMTVEELGGTIRVESEKGQGSTFYFDWKK